MEHTGLDDPDGVGVSGREDDAAVAWTQAAALFRPLPKVIDAIQNLVVDRSENNRGDGYTVEAPWRRYERMVQALIADD